MQPKMIAAAGPKGKEIPIPGVVRVPTYGTDYLPVRRERNTYIRPKGGSARHVPGPAAMASRCRACPGRRRTAVLVVNDDNLTALAMG